MKPPRLSDYALSGQRIEKLFRAGVGPTWCRRYFSWDQLLEIEREQGLPAGLAAHEWWIATKLVRRAVAVPAGRFTLALPPDAHRALHAIDRPDLPEATARDAVTAAIEEAVASAQLAGAPIATETAKQLLRSRRAARNADEQLVMSTFEALAAPADAVEPGAGPVHPVVGAILAHLDAADRRAGRAAFYGAMRAAGYDYVGLLSISTVMRRDPDAYERALREVDEDDGDATYFVLHQLEVIVRAIDDARRGLERSTRARAQAAELAPELNERQVALLQHALERPGARYTIEAHRASHDTVYETARSDLRELEAAGLLVRQKRGRAFVYSPVPNLSAKLRR